MTRLLITAAGLRFVAEPHPEAPTTVATFMKLLPYRQQLIHVRWSGEAVWVHHLLGLPRAVLSLRNLVAVGVRSLVGHRLDGHAKLKRSKLQACPVAAGEFCTSATHRFACQVPEARCHADSDSKNAHAMR